MFGILDTMFRFAHHTQKNDCEVPGGVVAYRFCVIDNRPESRAQLVDFGGADCSEEGFSRGRNVNINLKRLFLIEFHYLMSLSFNL